jgi:ketosteroid isomerase-like protein
MHGIERMRLFRAVALVAGAFLLLVHAAGATSVSPCAVVDNYQRAWGQQDLDGALALLADDAVVTVHDPRARVLASRTQIQEFLQYTAMRGAPILTSACQVADNTVTWSERPDTELNANDVTVRAVVSSGKIQSLVFRPGKLVQAPGSPTAVDKGTSEAAGLNLAGVLLLGLGLLSLATAFPHGGSDSNLRGRLLRDLRHWRPSISARPHAPR